MPIELDISRKLLPILQKPKRFKNIYGGRGSGKSQGLADLAIMQAAQGKKIGCFREFQNSLSDSMYSLIIEEIDRLGVKGFTEKNNEIHHVSGGKFVFKGLARNPDSIKSMHGFDIFVVEESQAVSEKSLKLLTPTLRKENGELWFAGNPQSSEDPYSQRLIEPWANELRKNGIYEDDMHLIVKCNWRDNPWFPDSLNQERLWDYENLPRTLYDHIWEGEYNDSVEHSIILAEWFDACVDAHEKLGFKAQGQIIAAHDPADTGDGRGYALRHGSVLLDVKETTTLDVNDACDWALSMAIESNADVFVWDADGLGLSLKRQVTDALDGKKVQYLPFRGGSAVERPDESYENKHGKSVTNADAFKNLRAQMYCTLRDRMYRTFRAVKKGEYSDPDKMFSISSKLECLAQLKAEVCRIPQVFNGNGQIQIMRKDQMKNKLKIKSPNLADAVMMTLLSTPKAKKWGKLNYEQVSIA